MRKTLLALLPALLLAVLPMVSSAGVFVGVSVNFGPPALPVYVQPPCPAPGYIWTPGYWAWNGDDYYWVPGTWVIAPTVGYLWTPGYWGWGDGVYVWHAGYWGPHVGFYGGINYGFGYTGVGYGGGYWHGHDFYYNRSVTNVNVTNVTNVYNKTVINNNVTVNRVSYNGGTGGVVAQPNATELRAANEHHVAFTPMQEKHQQMAASNRDLRASVNNGKPSVAATARPAVFNRGVIAARAAGGPVRPTMRSEANPGQAGHGPGPNQVAHENAMRTDRPPGAQGQHAQMAQGSFGAGHANPQMAHENAMRTDRPPGAQGQHAQTAQGSFGGGHANPQMAHENAMRTDRPPGAQGQHAQMAQGSFGGGRPNPQMAHSGGMAPGMNGRQNEMRAERPQQPQPQHFAERPSAPVQHYSAPAPRPAPAPRAENRGPSRQEPGRRF